MISNLEYYRVFFAVANFRHFTRAAEYLCVSQSAVSQSIRKLETELGCRLFERTGKGLVLTPEGEALFSHIRRAMQEIHTGENSISKLAALKTGELIVGASETSIRHYIPETIRRFKKDHPAIRITFRGLTTYDLCQRLQSGELEIAFLISPIPQGYDFNLIHLLDFQDVPVVASGLDIDRGRVYSTAELSAFPLIFVTSDNTVRSVIDEWFRQDNVIPTPEFVVRAMGLVLPLVREGLGVGIVPESYILAEEQAGALVRLKTESLPAKRSLYIATGPATPLSEAGREFIRCFQDRYAQE